MNPSVNDRLASVVRALEGVILPAIPSDAALAQEQAMLSIGHLQIILAQAEAAPAFEAAEAADMECMAAELAEAVEGGGNISESVLALRAAIAAPCSIPTARTATIQHAIDTVLIALSEGGAPDARKAATAIVLKHGAARAEKDRRWFAAMGFDIDYSAG